MAVSTGTQVGSTSDSGGSTSVATKGLVPTILGLAVEHGAITEDVNDTVATFRVSPAGIVKALQGKGLLDIYHDYSREPGFRFVSRFSQPPASTPASATVRARCWPTSSS